MCPDHSLNWPITSTAYFVIQSARIEEMECGKSPILKESRLPASTCLHAINGINWRTSYKLKINYHTCPIVTILFLVNSISTRPCVQAINTKSRTWSWPLEYPMNIWFSGWFYQPRRHQTCVQCKGFRTCPHGFLLPLSSIVFKSVPTF